MQQLGEHDELIARIAGLDPARSAAPISQGALERIARRAMHPDPAPWGRWRLRLAAFGTLVGTSAVVLAAIVGIDAAAPSLPVLTLGIPAGTSVSPLADGSTATSTQFGAQGANSYVQPTLPTVLTYEFTTGSSLPVTGGTAAAFELSSPITARAEAVRLAASFDVGGPVRSTYRGFYAVGPTTGPEVSTWTTSGVVNWSFRAGISVAQGGAPATGRASGPLPSRAEASLDALTLLGGLGISNTLGPAYIERSSSEVDVWVPIVVEGLSTDLYFYVTYGPSGVLESASGMVATVTAGAAYPTIPPSSAVSVLVRDHGSVGEGGLLPVTGLGPSSSATASAASAVHVAVDHATLGLSSYTLVDGTTWLLPTWSLTGPEHGDEIPAHTTYSADVLAIGSKYIRVKTISVKP